MQKSADRPLLSFADVLTKDRDYSFSEHDKGVRFERLMQKFLRVYPVYRGVFAHVWLWSEFPHRAKFGGRDTGIDLVAKTTTGDYWAIQCKCFDAEIYLDKPAVDSFLSTSSKSFTDENNETITFARRVWISTTNRWNREAENAIRNQNPPVTRISLSDLENSEIDWDKLEHGDISHARTPKKTLREHQQKAVDNFHQHFKTNDRGKLIMACGTGKTFTALKIAEQETPKNGAVLFLVPSIALLGQTLREWLNETDRQINPICICSDSEVGKKKTANDDTDSFNLVDLAYPASTSVSTISHQFSDAGKYVKNADMTVVFSTYQSIDVIANVQKSLNKKTPFIFDLVICDEAHRTTGFTLKDETESAFVKIHDQKYLNAHKRLYMTATPRLYSEDSKNKAQENEAVLCSMDDVALYGTEVYRIGFGEAVDKNLLADYKVLVLTMNEAQIPPALKHIIDDQQNEINADDLSKLVGCINALSKRMLIDEGLLKSSDPEPMRKAVAFCQNIKISKKIANMFEHHKGDYYDTLTAAERKEVVSVAADHIDGTMGATKRDDLLSWLKSTGNENNECKILCNVRCLSEGVDVPSLDAVMFLSPRNSQIDVVQSVGRVMRTAPNKKYGYIIIPVVIPENIPADQALDDNERFKVVWSVLNALRAHDDRFDAMVTKLDLNKKRTRDGASVLVGSIPPSESEKSEHGEPRKDKPPTGLFSAEDIAGLQKIVYARMVQKVGDKHYWEQWAKDVATIAQNYITRITQLVAESPQHQTTFANFLNGLRKNINPAVDEKSVIEMLAQHLITQPIFEALFENYSFVENNPVSQSMQKMVKLLESTALDQDKIKMERFYESVKRRISDIDNAQSKQRIIIELYDKFFKTAFPKVVEKLGIVYTPVEVVDFIIHSVANVLKQEFNRNLSDENIHILDPFTGTGTFITRLLQSGLIDVKNIQRKYEKELHANEIVLLAYYIASINIENAYHDIIAAEKTTEKPTAKTTAQILTLPRYENLQMVAESSPPQYGDKKLANKYVPFGGICLTDTFQLGESEVGEKFFTNEIFPQNSARVNRQRKSPLRIIFGNPPYSVGQKSANDNAQNQSYGKLDKRIAETYVKESKAVLNRGLYDSYIKAFRWSTDRLDKEHGGIIAFITNSGWLDKGIMDGFRQCLEQEFSSIYIFDLRGGIKGKSGDGAKREGQNVFNIMTGVAITVLVKNPKVKTDKATIYYHDIGEYLNRAEKIKLLQKHLKISAIKWETLKPNTHNDWLNKRDDLFGTFIPAQPIKNFDVNPQSIFNASIVTVSSGRDAWAYNYSRKKLTNNMTKMISFYNQQKEEYHKAKAKNKKLSVDDFIDLDKTKIAWTVNLKNYIDANKGILVDVKNNCIIAHYRPFAKQNFYYSRDLTERPGLSSQLFPNIDHENKCICIAGLGNRKGFFSLMTNVITDYHICDDGTKCFPLYYYEKNDISDKTLFDKNAADNYIRRDGVTDFILKQCRDLYGDKVTKEDIFYYVYGLLHSPAYRQRFSADLKKMLPRIPLVEKPADFWAFSKSGRELGDLHLNYETVAPHPEVKIHGAENNNFHVDKMKFLRKDDKTAIQYNPQIKITNIPLVAYDYLVNGKSAIEWILERYQIKINDDSQIKNDPNDWATEHAKPRYILDLLLSIINVSTKTVAIVNNLPTITFE